MIRYLIQKEFLQIRRNGFLPKLIIVFPIVIMCVMPWVMNMEVKNIRVSIVDLDRTPQSQRLVHEIEASDYFLFQGQQPSYQAALAEVEHDRTDVILEIRDGKYLIAANAVNGTKGSMGSAYLAQIVASTHSSPLSSHTTISFPSPRLWRGAGGEVLLYNKHQNYKLFMIPALFAILMMLITGFLPTLNIVGEKKPAQ